MNKTLLSLLINRLLKACKLAEVNLLETAINDVKDGRVSSLADFKNHLSACKN